MAVEEEVGAVFFVDDKATATLGRIGEAFEGIQAGMDAALAAGKEFGALRFGEVSRSIRGLADSVATLGGAIEELPLMFESAMGKIVGETERAARAVRSLRTELSLVGAGGGGALGGGGGGGGGRGGGGGGEGALGGGGGHGITASGLYRHGALSAFMFSPGGMLAGLGMEHALRLGGEYSLAVTNTMLAAGVNEPNAPENAGLRSKVEEMFNRATPGTRYNREQAATAGVPFMYLASGGFTNKDGSEMTPAQKIDAASGTYGTILRFAEGQQQHGLGNLDSNVQAGVKYMHLLRDYDPEKLNQDLSVLGAISRSTGTSAKAVESIQKYSGTVGNLFGVDPRTTALMTGYLGQSGVTGSTAGTGLSELMIEAYKRPKAGRSGETATPSQLSEARRELLGALNMTGSAARAARPRRQTSADEKRHELMEMGLIDASGRPLTLGADGKPDLEKTVAAVSNWSSRMEASGRQIEIADTILDVFKTRGARALEPFLGRIGQQQYATYKSNILRQAQEQDPAKIQLEQAKEPIQQFAQAWKRLEDAMIAFTDGPLHQLGTAAQAAADALEEIASFMDRHKDATSVMGDAATGAAVGAAVGAVLGPLGVAGGALLGGGAGLVFGGVRSMGVNPTTVGPTHGMPTGRDMSPTNMPTYDNPLMGPLPNEMLVKPQKQSYSAPSGGTHVEIKEIVFHGVAKDADHAGMIVREIAKKIGRAQLHDLGGGGGWQSSPYTSGRGVSV